MLPRAFPFSFLKNSILKPLVGTSKVGLCTRTGMGRDVEAQSRVSESEHSEKVFVLGCGVVAFVLQHQQVSWETI